MNDLISRAMRQIAIARRERRCKRTNGRAIRQSVYDLVEATPEDEFSQKSLVYHMTHAVESLGLRMEPDDQETLAFEFLRIALHLGQQIAPDAQRKMALRAYDLGDKLAVAEDS